MVHGYDEVFLKWRNGDMEGPKKETEKALESTSRDGRNVEVMSKIGRSKLASSMKTRLNYRQIDNELRNEVVKALLGLR